MSRLALYFVKLPRPGEVKTRLAAETSPESAAALYDALARAGFGVLRSGHIRTAVAHVPENPTSEVRTWLGKGVRYLVQRGEDLGERMRDAFEQAFGLGYERVVLVGSDVPGMAARQARAALEALTPERAALGPATDGGYWLIGFHKDGFAPQVFEGMPWSTPLVSTETMRRLAEAGLALHLAPELTDVDVLEDLAVVLGSGELDAASEAGRLAAAML